MAGKDKKLLAVFILTICGVLFAGYLTFTKLVLGICALNEPCPILFGKPVCVYGLIIYSILLILSGLLLFATFKKHKCMQKWLIGVSGFGILFAGYYTTLEIIHPACPLGVCKYALILPTCSWGLIMYIAIFVLSIMFYKARNPKH